MAIMSERYLSHVTTGRSGRTAIIKFYTLERTNFVYSAYVPVLWNGPLVITPLFLYLGGYGRQEGSSVVARNKAVYCCSFCD